MKFQLKSVSKPDGPFIESFLTGSKLFYMMN